MKTKMQSDVCAVVRVAHDLLDTKRPTALIKAVVCAAIPRLEFRARRFRLPITIRGFSRRGRLLWAFGETTEYMNHRAIRRAVLASVALQDAQGRRVSARVEIEAKPTN
jgi:hypothetical protein